jgi:molybdenum cofactor cytidylyltransferase
MAPPTVAALLAAGAGSRFESTDHKLVAPLRGRPVWEWALAAVMDAGFDHVIVVTGALTLRIPSPAVEHHNPRWRDGQATSVQVALAAADQLGASSSPSGSPTNRSSRCHLAGGRRCTGGRAHRHRHLRRVPGPNPVRLQAVWPLLPATGDLGARDVIRAHPEWVSSVACLGSTADIDTLEDLDRWNR